MDAILHRLAYDEEPVLHPTGTLYTDGLRDLSLFEEDLLVQRGEDWYIVPRYSSDPAMTLILFSKWYDMGGTGNFNMNRSGWSGSFSHGIASSGYYRSSHLIRTRLEWLPARALAQSMIELRRQAQSDECTWIDGVNPVEPDPNAQP